MVVSRQEERINFFICSRAGLLLPSVTDDAAKLRALFDVALDHGLVALIVHYVDEVQPFFNSSVTRTPSLSESSH